jgi:3-phosphoshikimate 1-carboxyvinyltransferase
MGALIQGHDGKAPLSFRPASLNGIEYELPVASAQVKSAILLAGLYAKGNTTIIQPGPARDHTERMLEAMGVSLKETGNMITLPEATTGQYHLTPLDMTVPGDLSSAAFLLVAAATIPHSRIRLKDVGLNHTRTGLLDILSEMGARITVKNSRVTGGEAIADLTAQFDEMHSTKVAGRQVVRAIDEFPIWAVASTQAAGRSSLSDAAELRMKEVDRIGLLTNELRKMGASISEHEDGMTIQGPTRLHGAFVNSHGDHRLGMALAIAGLVATGQTHISDADCVADSFPGFVETMGRLGANIEWRD